MKPIEALDTLILHSLIHSGPQLGPGRFVEKYAKGEVLDAIRKLKSDDTANLRTVLAGEVCKEDAT